MKTKSSIKIFLIPAILFAALFAFGNEARAAEYYYVATNGSDSNAGTSAAPWATFSKAMTILQPGDTLMIKDGTYNQSLTVTVSGNSGSPITIKAQNDGQAIIDGEFSRRPFQIVGTSLNHKHDIIVEGIRFQKSIWNVVDIIYADRITLKRVSAYDTDYNASGAGATAFLVMNSENILLEDCAASGWGRDLYEIYDSGYVTVRRCLGMWQGWGGATSVGGNIIIQLYGTSNSIVENFIGLKHPQAMSATLMGANVWCNTYNANASNNKYLGTVMWGPNSWAFVNASANHLITNNEFSDIVSINDAYGFYQRADANLHIKNATFVNATTAAFVLEEFPYEPKDGNYTINGDVRNSSFISNGSGYGFNINFTSVVKGFTHDYNYLFNFNGNYLGTSAGAHEIYVNPNFNTSTYGKGAYLMVPPALKGKGENGADIGATVLYRYQDGVLTSTPLWPWPMEDRIKAETGISVTWEANGGLWKTLCGVYGEGDGCSDDTTPPAAPSGLAIE